MQPTVPVYQNLVSLFDQTTKKYNMHLHIRLAESPAQKSWVPGTAMGCSIPENVLFHLYSHNFIDAKC